jgi:hypothetical protein
MCLQLFTILFNTHFFYLFYTLFIPLFHFGIYFLTNRYDIIPSFKLTDLTCMIYLNIFIHFHAHRLSKYFCFFFQNSLM